MKDTERKLLSELLKDCRRTDRQLAKAIGTSQPTVSRTIKRLESEGYIKEYTIIPDFAKLGYKIMAFTFAKLNKGITSDDIKKARKIALDLLQKGPFEIIMVERGIGLDSNGFIVTFHEDYSSHIQFRNWLKQFSFLEIDKIESFMVDLEDNVRYRPLTFSTLAKHLLTMKKREPE